MNWYFILYSLKLIERLCFNSLKQGGLHNQNISIINSEEEKKVWLIKGYFYDSLLNKQDIL